MAELSAFWTWARAHGRGVDWDLVQTAAGGWSAVQQASPQALQIWGVPPAAAAKRRDARASRPLGRVVTLEDSAYPSWLRAMPCPPPVLGVEGSLPEGRPLAIVGTRRCTAYGAGIARALGRSVVEVGGVVVSGLARGIDRHAHEGGLARTVAVLGHGLIHHAPRSNARLRDAIVSGGGAVVTAFPDDVAPRPHTFPIRNRWIAGLSEAVVVVEAGARSGASITARHALDLGRDVFAVPGPISSAASEGANRWLAQGATPVVSVRSFVEAWAGTTPPSADGWLGDVVGGEALDGVARRHGVPIAELIARIGALEADGVLVRLPGQRYALR